MYVLSHVYMCVNMYICAYTVYDVNVCIYSLALPAQRTENQCYSIRNEHISVRAWFLGPLFTKKEPMSLKETEENH